MQVLFTEHEDMIQALPPDAAEKALAHGVRARRSDRGLEHFRADPLSSTVEVWAKLVIPIPDDVPRPHPEGRRVAHLLGYPRTTRLA